MTLSRKDGIYFMSVPDFPYVLALSSEQELCKALFILNCYAKHPLAKRTWYGNKLRAYNESDEEWLDRIGNVSDGRKDWVRFILDRCVSDTKLTGFTFGGTCYEL